MTREQFDTLKVGQDIASCLDASAQTAVWYSGIIHSLEWPRINVKRDDGKEGMGTNATWFIRPDRDVNNRFISFSRNKINKLRRLAKKGRV